MEETQAAKGGGEKETEIEGCGTFRPADRLQKGTARRLISIR